MVSERTIDDVLSEAAAEVALKGVGKTGKNVQQGYSFRPVDSILDAVGPALAKRGVVVTPKFSDRTQERVQTQKGGTLVFVTVVGEFTYWWKGESRTTVTIGEAMDSADKATNKAMAMAAKYAHLLTLSIPVVGSDDADLHAYAAGLPVSTETINPETGEVTATGGFAALQDKVEKNDGAGVSPPVSSSGPVAEVETGIGAPAGASFPSAADLPPLKNARGGLIVANVVPWVMAADKKMGDLFEDHAACDVMWDELRPTAELLRSKNLQDEKAAGAVASLFRSVEMRVEARKPVPVPV